MFKNITYCYNTYNIAKIIKKIYLIFNPFTIDMFFWHVMNDRCMFTIYTQHLFVRWSHLHFKFFIFQFEKLLWQNMQLQSEVMILPSSPTFTLHQKSDTPPWKFSNEWSVKKCYILRKKCFEFSKKNPHNFHEIWHCKNSMTNEKNFKKKCIIKNLH